MLNIFRRHSSRNYQKKIHKIYLIIGIVVGLMTAILMPFFNDPDGQYHFEISSGMVGLSSDLTKYGETDRWFDGQFQHQYPAYQRREFFEKYYLTHADIVPTATLPRANTMPEVLSYNFMGHIIPAVGVWIGYHLYPSMGMMITTARLLNTFISVLVMYGIIKYVKRGKILFATLSLSPVIVGTFASLSYDGLSYLLVAALVAVSINMIVDKRLDIRRGIGCLALILFSLVAAKTNLQLLVLMPLIVMGWLLIMKVPVGLRVKGKKLLTTWPAYIIGLLLVAGGLFVVNKVLGNYGGTVHVLWRFIINLIFNFGAAFNSTSVFIRLLGEIVPIWFTSIWYILILVAVLAEEKFVENRFISWAALGIFMLNVAAVYLTFMNFPSGTGNQAMHGAIAGMQGRYFTPAFLLLAIFAGNIRYKSRVNPNTVIVFMTIFTVVSNVVAIFATLFGIIYMNMPQM